MAQKYLCQNTIAFDDIAIYARYRCQTFSGPRCRRFQYQHPSSLTATEIKGRDKTTFSKLPVSRGSDCAPTGRVKVEWSPDPRIRGLCGPCVRRRYGGCVTFTQDFFTFTIILPAQIERCRPEVTGGDTWTESISHCFSFLGGETTTCELHFMWEFNEAALPFRTGFNISLSVRGTRRTIHPLTHCQGTCTLP
jgi:hypothetical protein